LSDLPKVSMVTGKKSSLYGKMIGGIAFTAGVALLGMGLAKVPWIGMLGPMLLSIFIAVIYRQVAGYPVVLRPGIDFAAKKILRLAIILYGFKLNVNVIIQDGLPLLLKGILVIAIAIGVTMLVAKWIKADSSIALLLAVGTGICGAAAIAAVSPIAGAKEEDTAIGVGIIALTGTVFAAVYTLLYTLAGLDANSYGAWVGVSLHEIAHVVAASAPAGEGALAVALLAKLGRVCMLIPLCLLLTYWINRKRAKKGEDGDGVQAKAAFPWFLLGFVVTSLMGTYFHLPKELLQYLTTLSTFLLTAAMVGLGLNVSFHAVRTKALRPALAMLCASVLIAVVTFFIV
jgi:uncharacterized integral membrane protein (TIGR00698 family)